MALPFFNWSKTAASNGNSDSTVNWAEGQSPSSVNDSARAMMASTAGWRDDISGTITTGGTSTAYTVTSNQVFDTLAHMNGAMIAFVPHATNGATVTLNCDGLGAKPLRSAPSVELPAGVLVQGTPYVATYNNSDAVFYLRGFYAIPYAIPIGMLAPYGGTTAPNSNFALACGQAISRTTYATLFALMGTTFGAGDGSTTFAVPDLRGRAVFGQDGIGGFGTTSRITVAGGNFNGTTLGATGGNEAHTLSQAEIPAHVHVNTLTDPGHVHVIAQGSTPVGPPAAQVVAATAATGSTSAMVTNTATGITINNASAGTGNSHTILPPAIVLPYILRVI